MNYRREIRGADCSRRRCNDAYEDSHTIEDQRLRDPGSSSSERDSSPIRKYSATETELKPDRKEIAKRSEVMKPQIYDGKESVHSFIAHFEVCAKFNKWTDLDKCAWLQWALKGRAQQVLWDLPSSQLTSYEGIAKVLRERLVLKTSARFTGLNCVIDGEVREKI
jgi:hypothetical protein